MAVPRADGPQPRWAGREGGYIPVTIGAKTYNAYVALALVSCDLMDALFVTSVLGGPRGTHPGGASASAPGTAQRCEPGLSDRHSPAGWHTQTVAP